MAPVCTNCGFNNPPGMRFCGNCGTRLPAGETRPRETWSRISEPEPGAGLAQQSISPEQLGVLTGADLLERFRQAGLEANGQRRSVTVLFVDLTGYTHLAAELPDEDLYELVQKFISLLVNDVYKYEGMVDKLTGDGLMALFGAPIAHENNAERAVRSALDMQADVARLNRELNLDCRELQIHVGLHAGTVIVGGLGGDGIMNYTAIGDSVNLARRLEEAAGPGTILVSESVYRQTRQLFEFTELPPLSLKNIAHQVTAFQVVGPKARPGSVRGLEGLRAPMIGREAELQRVQGMVDRLLAEGRGGVVFLVGEGGMGKSRLTSELKARLDYSALRVLEGHSLTYRKSIAYWIFQDMLLSSLGVTFESSEEEIRRRLTDRVLAVMPEQGREKLLYLEHLLSLRPSDPQQAERIQYLDAGQLRQQIFLAVRDYLFGEAHQRPLMLILEDLHWADDASLDLVRFLLDSTRQAPILIYAISRPFEGGAIQAIHERASQRLPERYLYIRLQALHPDQSAQLLQALLAMQDLPESLRQQIIQRSAGLPFYLEEILRMLIENQVIYREGDRWLLTPGANASSIGVPETLQGLILTRFDRLPPGLRRFLQTASVVGYQFNAQVLQHVIAARAGETEEYPIDEAIDLLAEREFIVPQAVENPRVGDGSSAKEQNYVFKHALVSDAVYSTLLQRDRRELHNLVAQAIEQIYADHLDGQIEVLASHYLRSPQLERAVHYLTLAGQKAARSYANDQARHFFQQALDLLPKASPTDEQLLQIFTGMGDVLYIAGEYISAREHYHRALEALGMVRRTGALPSLDEATKPMYWDAKTRLRLASRLKCNISKTYEGQGDYEMALTHLRSAQSLLGDVADDYPVEQASIQNDMGWIYFRRGNLEQAETLLLEGLSLAERTGQLDVIASILNRLAGIYFQRGAVDLAQPYLVRSLALREQIGDVVAVARSYNNLGLLRWKQGKLAEALHDFDRSFRLQSNLGDVEGMIVLLTNMGLIEMDRGSLKDAEAHFQEALETAGQIGHYFHVCLARMHLALLNVYAGNWPAAVEHGQLSLAGFQELGVQENLVDLNVSLGWAYLGLGDADHLEEILQRLEELLAQEEERSGGPSEGRGRALRLMARVSFEQGNLNAAREALEQSAAIFEQVGNELERSRSLVDLARLLITQGEVREAQALLDCAREVFTRLGTRLELERLQQLMDRHS